MTKFKAYDWEDRLLGFIYAPNAESAIRKAQDKYKTTIGFVEEA